MFRRCCLYILRLCAVVWATYIPAWPQQQMSRGVSTKKRQPYRQCLLPNRTLKIYATPRKQSARTLFSTQSGQDSVRRPAIYFKTARRASLSLSLSHQMRWTRIFDCTPYWFRRFAHRDYWSTCVWRSLNRPTNTMCGVITKENNKNGERGGGLKKKIGATA